MKIKTLFCYFALCISCMVNAHPQQSFDPEPVATALDNFHQAAADANGKEYFNLLAEQSVFIGTDASERWSKQQFKQYAMPYFDQGKGWTYTPRDRHIQFSHNGKTAWFDEMLDNASYGECRGTGVLELTTDGWKILQYHLTVPVPNDLLNGVAEQIRQLEQ